MRGLTLWAFIIGASSSFAQNQKVLHGSSQDLNHVGQPSYRQWPDHHWHHVMHGAQLSHDGALDSYSLRARKNDPAKLGLDNVTQFSGYLDDNGQDKHLFYSDKSLPGFFESRNDPENDPVLLWLQGGPGCSSMMGLLLEIGPGRINKARKIEHNEFAWNNNASVLFVDQPVGSGFSYGTGRVKSTMAAARDVYALLTLFFEQFPQYGKQPLHIFGESYGGHFLPAISAEILSHPHRNINLRSMAIGNGMTDEYTQYRYFRPMACGEGGYPAILSKTQCLTMAAALPLCEAMIQGCYLSDNTLGCVAAETYCNFATFVPVQSSGRNLYDIRMECEDGNTLCYDAMDWVVDWLNRPQVLEELGVEVDRFDYCDFNITTSFRQNGDWMKPMHRHVPDILEEIPVLVFAGDADYSCNWLGNLAWTEALEWPHREEYQAAPLEDLLGADGEKYGEVKSSGGLSFVKILNAGHLAPMDQPKNMFDMLSKWIGKQGREGGDWYDNSAR